MVRADTVNRTESPHRRTNAVVEPGHSVLRACIEPGYFCHEPSPHTRCRGTFPRGAGFPTKLYSGIIILSSKWRGEISPKLVSLPQVTSAVCVSHTAHVPLNVCTALHRPSAHIRASSKSLGLVAFWGASRPLVICGEWNPKEDTFCGRQLGYKGRILSSLIRDPPSRSTHPHPRSPSLLIHC